MRSLVEVARNRNVTRLQSVGVTEPLGSITVGALLDLETNFEQRLSESHHEWKSERLRQDLAAVAGELAARGIVELSA